MSEKIEKNLPAWVRLVKSVLFCEERLDNERKFDEFSNGKGDARHERS